MTTMKTRMRKKRGTGKTMKMRRRTKGKNRIREKKLAMIIVTTMAARNHRMAHMVKPVTTSKMMKEAVKKKKTTRGQRMGQMMVTTTMMRRWSSQIKRTIAMRSHHGDRKERLSTLWMGSSAIGESAMLMKYTFSIMDPCHVESGYRGRWTC